MRVKVLLAAPCYPPGIAGGGPARSLSNLVEEVEDRYDLLVVTPDRDYGADAAYPMDTRVRPRGNSTRVEYVNVSDPREAFRVVASIREWRPDILLLNSVWNRPMSIFPLVLRELGLMKFRGVVVMPRGEFEVGALALKPTRKALVSPALRWLHSRQVDAYGATSPSERAAIARWRPGATALLTDNTPDAIPFWIDERILDDARPLRLLFLGRVNEKKGLLELLEALMNCVSAVHLSICGPIDGEAYWRKCRSVMQGLPRHIRSTYMGPAIREDVPGLLHTHDAMVALTSGENFGHTFAEALQAGCPVIATDATPWTSVLAQGGGWLISDRNDRTEVSTRVDALAAIPTSQRVAFRKNARIAYDEWSRTRPPNVIDQAVSWMLLAGAQ